MTDKQKQALYGIGIEVFDNFDVGGILLVPQRKEGETTEELSKRCVKIIHTDDDPPPKKYPTSGWVEIRKGDYVARYRATEAGPINGNGNLLDVWGWYERDGWTVTPVPSRLDVLREVAEWEMCFDEAPSFWKKIAKEIAAEERKEAQCEALAMA